MCAARQAGGSEATTATEARSAPTTAIVTGSPGLTP